MSQGGGVVVGVGCMEHHTTAGTLMVGEVRRNLISGKTVSYQAGTERRHCARVGTGGGRGFNSISEMACRVCSAPQWLDATPLSSNGLLLGYSYDNLLPCLTASVLQKKK